MTSTTEQAAEQAAIRDGGRTSRRLFLGLTGAGATAVMTGIGAWDVTNASAAPLKAYPFTLGVASGDPLPDGIVLWTRLAIDPIAPDGRGGMPNRQIPVKYQVAEDEKFRKVVHNGTALATPELNHSVHPEVNGLRPDREYFYRFQVGTDISPVGRTRTAPAASTALKELGFAFASCQSYEGGQYTAYSHLAEEDIDLIVHLGDYIYEESYLAAPEFHEGGLLPDHLRTECLDLPRYRLQYSLYKTDQHLQAAHQQHPWAFTFDDHEVNNNFRGTNLDDAGRARQAAAFQAMYENLPLRHAQRPDGPDIQIYRKLRYGTLADFTLLDSHQFRGPTSSSNRDSPEYTNLGHTQRDWLVDSFSSSQAKWQVIGNQQSMTEIDQDPDPDVTKITGGWDYYVYERNLILREARDRDVDNLVVITGDRHANYVCDLLTDYAHPDTADLVGSEFIGTSISTNGDGAPDSPVATRLLAANPHMKLANFQRGYSRVTVTPETFTNEFKIVPYVSTPGAPLETLATFVVEDGVPGSVRSDTPS